jgi:SAM-dependent methyltransferase
MDQEQKTKEFFNTISKGYRDRYENQTPFHRYFFQQRLEKATAQLDFNHKSVLDIGSGTGNLYDYIFEKFPSVDFYATDISEGMLRQSNVPQDRKYAGHCYDIPFRQQTFDYIFLLGVTTYMTGEELDKTIDFIRSRLSSGGLAIISFTNKRSYDYQLRRVLKKPLQLLFKRKDRVLMQDFAAAAYSPQEVHALVSGRLRIEKTDYLNHTIFPFNFLFSSFSLARAKKISRGNYCKNFLERNSSDLLVRFSVIPG